ncbi:ATP-dependent DNA ligase [Streptomyces rubrogriseus]|uniref:ATP-dependent DNA ligase n=1 Tax=Streptomyces rubrogriseus TaxID=194673 RepID=UPI0036BD24FE
MSPSQDSTDGCCIRLICSTLHTASSGRAGDEEHVVVHIDGELVVREGARLAFERLQQRMARRRGAGALATARTWPAYLVVFDVLSLEGADLTLWPYTRRGPLRRPCSRTRP